MTSRERLLAALNHREPDRVPFDLGSTQVTGISIVAYQNLFRHLGKPEADATVCDVIQQLALPHDGFLDSLGVDVRGLWPISSHNDDFEIRNDGPFLRRTDDWGLEYRMKKDGGLWFDLVGSPLRDKTLSPDVICGHAWPEPSDSRRFRGLLERAREIRKSGRATVLKSICAGLLEMACRLRGTEDFLLDLVSDPVNAGLLLDKILELKIRYWDAVLGELHGWVDVAAEGDDYGTQQSQIISHAMYRDALHPRLAVLVGFIKKKEPGIRVFFHSCGNVREFLPDFIGMGIDILNPVHVAARGMDPVALKRDFGKDIVFWGGGIDTQTLLPFGTPEAVRQGVRRNIEALAPGGGFVFNTVHNIQADVPPQNIVAMVEALHRYGAY
jgi:uroporphyrinogen decarboxylase